jgi:hypothetical protein
MDLDLEKSDAPAGSPVAVNESRAHFRYQLWSSASHALAVRATGSHRYASAASHDAANGLDEPVPDAPHAAGSHAPKSADNAV